MSLFLLASDLHLADRPPSSCTESYADDLFALLGHIAQLAADRKCTAIVLAGDIFHSKAPSRTSHRLMQRMISWVQGCYPRPVLIVPGNHDIQHDRLETIMLTQPLGVLLRAGAYLLDGWLPPNLIARPDPAFRSMLPLYGVPWLQHWTTDAVTDALAGYRRHVEGLLGNGPVQLLPHFLVVTHAPLYPPGFELPYEFFDAEQWALSMGTSAFMKGESAGSCFYGHVHEAHGVWHGRGGPSGGEVTFCNFGALSRGSLHEHNLTREIAVALWDDQTGEFERVVLPHRPAAEVFRLAEKEQAADVQGRLDEFLQQVGQAQLEVLSVESVIAHVRGLNLDKGLEALVIELLEAS